MASLNAPWILLKIELIPGILLLYLAVFTVEERLLLEMLTVVLVVAVAELDERVDDIGKVEAETEIGQLGFEDNEAEEDEVTVWVDNAVAINCESLLTVEERQEGEEKEEEDEDEEEEEEEEEEDEDEEEEEEEEAEEEEEWEEEEEEWEE